MIPSPEYVGPFRWDEARERVHNDYRTKDDVRTEYPNATGQEVWEMEKNEDIKNDEIVYF